MGKLVIDGNKVYTVDEACMKKKKLTLAQIQGSEQTQQTEQAQHLRQRRRPPAGRGFPWQ
ncbi:MAG: hypothetical protein K2P45_04285 [Eubacterium sp.]|nr:hypothetical protein [Eubacterium sp.]